MRARILRLGKLSIDDVLSEIETEVKIAETELE